MTHQRLDGQTVLITGAARRIGAEIARACHGEGANVVVHYRHSSADAEALVGALNERRAGSALALGADLLDLASHAPLIERTLAQFGRLDALINNASTFYPTRVGDITPADWDDLLGSNLKAPLFLSQAATPALTQARGAIINLVDIHGMRPLAAHPVYCAAKAGLIMLTRSLARELGPAVRVNGIAPGPILWPENDIGEPEKAAIVASTALQRSGGPGDIARTALFFLADAPYVTGQILAVDGGRSIG
jgi:pteridine reductase